MSAFIPPIAVKNFCRGAVFYSLLKNKVYLVFVTFRVGRLSFKRFSAGVNSVYIVSEVR